MSDGSHLAVLCPGPDPLMMIYLLAQFAVFAAAPVIGVGFAVAVVKLAKEIGAAKDGGG